MGKLLRIRGLGLAAILAAASTPAADLKVGDTLPNCAKIPLLNVQESYRPQATNIQTLERWLLNDGVTIVHFLTPRPKRGGKFETDFLQQLSDLQKASHSVPYPCTAIAVVPFGNKGKDDAFAIMNAAERPAWGETTVFFEPTYPRPGLYRTFRPDANAENGADLPTPYTFLIGPGRKILAVRTPESTVPLYDWLQQSLPQNVVAVPKSPSSALSVPAEGAWVWPIFRRSPQHQTPASMLPDVLPYTYLAWKSTIGRTFASPVVVDNVVYANSDSGGLRSLNLITGQALGGFNMGPSWWSSPAVAGPMVYTVSSQGTVHAVDRGTYLQRWRRDIGGLATSSPIVANGTLYIGSRDGAMYALDAVTGERLWRFQTGGEISSSPALANGMLVFGSGDRCVYAIDAATGASKWIAQTDGPVDSSPTVADGSVYVGSFDGSLVSLKLADGTVNWKSALGGWVHSSPAVDEDRVFVGTVNIRREEAPAFYWLDRKTGKVLGKFETPDAMYSSPTVWGDLVLIGCRDRQLYAFDRKMRQTQPAWTFRTRSYVHSTPVVVGDTVLVASFDGDLYALRQAKPIRSWNDQDIVPRWFVAAMSRELHKEMGELIVRSAGGKVGGELTLRKFTDVLAEIKANASKQAPAPKILPRDIPAEHPGAPYVEYVLTAGLLSGYPDGTFKPNEPTTRYQFSLGLATVFGLVTRPDFAWKSLGEKGAQNAQVEVRVSPLPGRPRNLPRDVNPNHWAYEALNDLAAAALNPLDDEGNFKGGRLLTLKDAETQWNLFVETLKVVRLK